MLAVSALMLVLVGYAACIVLNTRVVSVELGGESGQTSITCDLPDPVVFYKLAKATNGTVNNKTTAELLFPGSDGAFTVNGKTLNFTKLMDSIDLEDYDYKCKTFSKTDDIQFNITVKPLCKIMDGSHSPSVTVGAFKQLRCITLAGNYTNSKWTWHKDGQLVNNTDKHSIAAVKHESILTINNVETSDQGVYTCILSNDFGSHSQTINFEVIGVFSSLLYYLIVVAQVAAITVLVLVLEKRSQKKKHLLEDESSRSTQRTTRA